MKKIRALSSVGQSIRLITGRSRVRIPEGPPKLHALISAALAVIILITAVSGCVFSSAKISNEPASQGVAASPFKTYKDIPGVLPEEEAAIDALVGKYSSLSYGMTPASEAYYDGDGRVRGFSALVTEWLSELFGIAFVPEIHEWDDLNNKLNALELDFVGNLAISEERQTRYSMTSAVARRGIKYLWLIDNPSPAELAVIQTPRYAFLKGATTYDFVAPHISGEFELFFADDYAHAHQMLINGEVDAFILEGSNEAAFDIYGDVISSVFFPPVYSPIALATANPELKPIIDVIQKALVNGGASYLAELYNIGEREYLRYKLATMLTEEEREYIRSHPFVTMAVEPANYPISFYNSYENEWQGIFFEVLEEVEELTGLKFKRINDQDASWIELLEMLESGEAAMISELLETDGRKGDYLWPEVAFMKDSIVLISKSGFRNIQINEIIYLKLGVVERSAYAELLLDWFPNHNNLSFYQSTLDAFDALDDGKVDMVMTSRPKILMLTQYLERADYKTNFVFEYPFYSTMGFNKNEDVLRSIIDKALYQIDTEIITSNWIHKTYDYRTRVAQAQRPWLVGASISLVCVLLLLVIIISRKNSEGRRLAILVAEQTEEVTNASKAKSEFLANMNHEIRTPVNVIVGLTELLMEEDIPADGIIGDYLRKINTAGSTLIDLINDILDISKIEAGKFTLSPADYDLASLINDVVTLNITRIGEKPITFNLDFKGDLYINLNGDDLTVRQVLNNMLSNAIKYTREGSVTLTAGCERINEYEVKVLFSVADTGAGIREDDLKKLFSEYNQVDKQANRKIEGTGLGLSITKKLVQLMGGDITVESEYGKGSVFSVHIIQGYVNGTLIDAQTLENLRSFRYRDRKKTAQRLKRPDLGWARALVVDDSKANLDVAQGLLSRYKIGIDCVTRGQDAIDVIRRGEPVYNVVFMDHMMPEIDGVETTSLIRAIDSEYARTVPIIALTANAVAGNEQLFVDKGFQAFLSKPLSTAKLDVAIHKWVMKDAGTSAYVLAAEGVTGLADVARPEAGAEAVAGSTVTQEPGVTPEKTPEQPEPPSAQRPTAIKPKRLPSIPGIDMEAGLAVYGGSVEMFASSLRGYIKYIPGMLDNLRGLTEQALPEYAISIHAIKGNSSYIGAMELMDRAAKMEKIAKAGDYQEILAMNGIFIKYAEALAMNIEAWLAEI